MLGGECLVPVSAVVQTFSGDVDEQIGDPVRRLEVASKLSPAGGARSASLPVVVDVPGDSSARITLDMGQVVMGQVQFELSAPAGTVLDFFLHRRSTLPPEGWFWRHAFRHALHMPGRK